MVAAYVSALANFRYWLCSNRWFLKLQGGAYGPVAEALRNGDVDAEGLVRPHRRLLDVVETITRHAYRVTDEQVQELRGAGWSDEQIAEAAYDAALFNLFVRLADTFGIEPPAIYEPNGVPAAAAPSP